MRWLFLATLCLVSLLANRAPSQCTPLTYAARTWVDPVNGNDITGAVGLPWRPYATLGGAIAETANFISGGGEGLVIALPGIYSYWTNGELTPVVMRDRVHVAGVGAKECVLRGSQGWYTPVTCLYPIAGTSGVQIPKEVGFWFQNTTADDASEASLEGFTIQYCQVQVFASSESDIRGRVSNCYFDMRSSGEAVGGPEFGVLINNVLQSLGIGGIPQYQDARLKLFNNTFIMATRLPGGTIESARPDAVAICDTNWGNPNPSGPKDPDTECRGVSRPSIQNNIIRDLLTAKRTAMLGIDDTDTSITVGTMVGATNAFDPTTVGPTDPTNAYFCKWQGMPSSRAAPRVDTSVQDPGFVGELVGQLKANASNWHVRLEDFRLVPDSPMIDRGSSPAYGAAACTANFTAVNGTNYIDYPITDWEHGSFDYDGEGHGNLRTVAITSPTPRVDIGFDEADTLIVAGSYAAWSRSHNTSWSQPWIDPGDEHRYYLTRNMGTPVAMAVACTIVGYSTSIAYSIYPGLAPNAPPFIPLPGIASSNVWLTNNWQLLPGIFPMTVTTVPGITGPHTFNVFQLDMFEQPGSISFFNEQAFYLDVGTGAFASFPLDRLSNSQSEHF